MEDVMTCLCGHQEWKLFGDRIRCAKCSRQYSFATEQKAADLMGMVNSKEESPEGCLEVDGGEREIR